MQCFRDSRGGRMLPPPQKRAAYDSGTRSGPPAASGATASSARSLTPGGRSPGARIRGSCERIQGVFLMEPSAVPLIVLSASRDPVEAINGILRRAGEPAHCTWIPALRDLGDALTQINPELLVHVMADDQEL